MMPDRIIRDELFRSPRFIRLTSDTLRILFIGFLLHADDLANAEAATESIEDILHRDVPDETAARWIAELADAGLVRVYSDPENPEKRLIHIPRFRQRLRYIKGRHPNPPPEVESKEIKQLREQVRLKSDRSQSVDGLKTAEVKRSEVKRSEELLKPSRAHAPATNPATTTELPTQPGNPILKIGKTIQNLTLTAKAPKTDAEKEAERARQLAYVAAQTKGSPS